MPLSRKEVKEIISHYRNPEFPGSFAGALKFKHALKEHLGINVKQRELQNILDKDLAYNMEKVKKKSIHNRRIVANGVGISAQIDVGRIHLKIDPSKKGTSKTLDYYFLMVIDIMSRFIYCLELPVNINKNTLKSALETLLNGSQKMPRFVEA